MSNFEQVRQVLGDVLQLGERTDQLDSNSGLLGQLPEFDSLAVVGLITALEAEFKITIHDDDISGETFETVGTLAQLVESKRNA